MWRPFFIVLLSCKLFAQTQESNLTIEPQTEDANLTIELQIASPWHLYAHGQAWMMQWNQTSDAKSTFGSDAIIVDYAIENALAASANLALSLWGYTLNLDYTTAAKGVKSLNALQANIHTVKYMNMFNLYINYESSTFKGSIDGVAIDTNTTGSGTFHTALHLYDVLGYFFDVVGFGIRYIDYEFPQDLYLVKKSDPTTIVGGIKGLEEIHYTGYYLQMALDNARLNASGWIYALKAGVGRVIPSGAFIDSVNTALVGLNNGSVMQYADSYFVEAQLGYNLQGAIAQTFYWHAQGGYRYARMHTTVEAVAEYSLVANFTTEFSGPYMAFGASF